MSYHCSLCGKAGAKLIHVSDGSSDVAWCRFVCDPPCKSLLFDCHGWSLVRVNAADENLVRKAEQT